MSLLHQRILILHALLDQALFDRHHVNLIAHRLSQKLSDVNFIVVICGVCDQWLLEYLYSMAVFRTTPL